MNHDFDCECAKCTQEVDDVLEDLFPNANTKEELEEELTRSWEKSLDR